MGNVIHIDDRKRIQEDAAAWLSRIDRGLTDTERTGLDSWLQSDQRHIAAFLELAKAWDKLEDLGALSGLVELPGIAQTPAGKSRQVVAVDDSLLLSFGPRTPSLISELATAFGVIKSA